MSGLFPSKWTTLVMGLQVCGHSIFGHTGRDYLNVNACAVTSGHYSISGLEGQIFML